MKVRWTKEEIDTIKRKMEMTKEILSDTKKGGDNILYLLPIRRLSIVKEDNNNEEE